MTITVPLQGSHQVRLETPQSEGHPFQSFASAQIQCGQFMLNQSTISTNEDDPQMDESCANIVDSYDPNEKQVYPSGITAAGNILERRELKYTLFFQNTGSDTAYKVVLIDTLDSDFDIAEFQQGPSSHPFQLSISGKGRPVLTYTFTNINLPHKGANEEKSNGFVSFSIKPKADAAIGTRLENFADIYFDYNDLIRTNTTVNTLWRPTLVDGVLDTVFTVAARPLAHSVQTSIHPNPSKGNVEFNLAKAGTMQIFNLQGQVIETHSMGKGKNQLNLAALPKGLYLLKLQTEGSIQSQKLVLE
jgi:hypothetical protein